MRIVGYLFLFLLAFAITAVWKFPAAGVLPFVNVEPVKLSGVSGSIWSGSAQQITAPSLGLPINNASWKFQPAALLSGSAGAKINFDVLGGSGDGTVQRDLAGNVSVSNGKFSVPATNLEQFLPLPVAKFAGVLLADLEALELENNLLKTTQGKVIWSNSAIDINFGNKVLVKLGQVVFDIVPQGDGQHIGKLSNKDGQLELKGEILLDQAGNFKSDVVIKPTAQTPSDVTQLLGQMGQRAASDGSYRHRNNGNIQDFM